MSAPLQVRIETLTIHARSVPDARALADALPAALERALTARAPNAHPTDAGVLNAGEIRLPPGAPGLADSVARRLVDAALVDAPLIDATLVGGPRR